MDELVELWEQPAETGCYMLAGWEQWADAGATSSALPRYLIEHTAARKIGEIRPDGFYLFQVPGMHYLMRPHVKVADGYRASMSTHHNDIYEATLGEKHLLIFEGEEPHMAEERYAGAFLDTAAALGVKRVLAVGGVFGPVPYEKERAVSCVYSQPDLRSQLDRLAVRFSDYEGGTTLCTYLAHKAEARGIEFVALYAIVPAYDFSEVGLTMHGLRVEQDWRAWYDIVRRLNYMSGLDIDVADLEKRSRELVTSWDDKIDKLVEEHPDLHLRELLETIASGFEERPFIPLDAAWDALGDLLKGMDN